MEAEWIRGLREELSSGPFPPPPGGIRMDADAVQIRHLRGTTHLHEGQYTLVVAAGASFLSDKTYTIFMTAHVDATTCEVTNVLVDF